MRRSSYRGWQAAGSSPPAAVTACAFRFTPTTTNLTWTPPLPRWTPNRPSLFARRGPRGHAVAFTLGSVSAAATGLVRGLGDLLLCRILLGIGESVYLPGGMKVVSLHFRAEESALPAGSFDLGAKVGLAVGTTIDVWLLARFGWRSLFFRTGLAGLIWLMPWLWLYPPVRAGRTRTAPPRVAWQRLLRDRRLLAMSLSGLACGNMLVVPRICAPDDEVALWTGVQNFIGNIGGVLAPAVTGVVIARTHSYVPAFFIVAALLLVGIAAYTVMLPRL